MDLQTIFNLAVGIGGAACGWILNTLWGAIKDLQRDEKTLTDKVGAIEVLVAGRYVPRGELSKQFEAINGALRRIEDKLDSKADKP